MNRITLKSLKGLLAGLASILSMQAAVTVQDPNNVIGTGTNAWSYLIVEGESYDPDTKLNTSPGAGFTAVDASGAITNALGNPVLGKNTTASKRGALFTQTIFAQHSDKVTYRVQFSKPGTYYLYMRFTMFENGGNLAHYLNEDSFFVPPDFGKDPQTDWPLSDRGGYAEGCCDAAGFLYIPENGVKVNRGGGDEAGRLYWEGNFHWNELLASQFLNPDTQGEPRMRFKYEVKADQVGKPLDWTISYREGGLTIDLFLFSTNPDLMTLHTQADLDSMLLPPPAGLSVQSATNVVGTGTNAWSYLVVEGENYDPATKLNTAAGAGFTAVDNSGAITNALGNPVLGRNTGASKKGALFTQTVFAQHSDKVTYRVQFSKPGTYYLYMRFTMFENGGNLAHYLNEDSFFVPPDFGKDPQTDWPLSDRGGYAEGCCDAAGFLYIPENGVRVNHGGGDEAGRLFWEGNFHWNNLISSQFLNAETQGEPRVHFKYEVKADQVGKPLDWTISYREGGVTIDLFLFSTNPDLLNLYSQADLDRLIIPPPPNLTVQDPSNVVGTGTNAWSYLVLEGEKFDPATKMNTAAGAGFVAVDASGSISNALGNPILGKDTTASGKGALFTQTIFGQHSDKVTYHVQFSKAGTYYLYMRFTMFENGGNLAHYLNEDSFFVPPDFGKDPQTDWPLSDRGGYAEGCCDAAGFLYIPENGVKVNRGGGDEAGRLYWEGNFHWNELISSQFLNPDTQGEPRMRFKYEVTPDKVGKPLDWTISYREGGVTIDLFLFSTNPDLLTTLSQDDLENLFINKASAPKLSGTRNGRNIVLSWPAPSTGYVLESATTLTRPTWTAVAGSPVVNGGVNSVTVDASTGTRFYRLRKP